MPPDLIASELTQHLLLTVYVLVAGVVTAHVLLTKSNVRAALGWIAVAWLSPVFGALLYIVLGINRVTRRALPFRSPENERIGVIGPEAQLPVPPNIATLSAMGQRVTGSPLMPGNAVSVLRGGDEAYPAMLAAIRDARHSVALASYIFRDDAIGHSFINALIEAQRRGVAVRVLIDSIGSGYFLSPTLRHLQAGQVPTARFLHTWVPWRMPFLNMRNHKKLLIIDGTVGFTGGLNIGAEHSGRIALKDYVDSVHVRVEGPVISQLMDTFARDWHFTTDEVLDQEVCGRTSNLRDRSSPAASIQDRMRIGIRLRLSSEPRLHRRKRKSGSDLPPLKWSSLKYYFGRGGYEYGQEEAYGGRDRCQASAGRRADGSGSAGGGRGPGDRRNGSNVLSMAQ